MICRFLAGKLNEAHELLHKKYYGTKVSQKLEINEEAKDALDKINEYFNKKPNILRIMRNAYSFHYSEMFPKGVSDTLNRIPPAGEEEDWSIYFHDTNGNTLFYLCDVLANADMIKEIDSDPGNPDFARSMARMLDEMLSTSKLFITAFNLLVLAILLKYWPDPSIFELPKIHLKNLPIGEEISIPYFFEPLTASNKGNN